MIELPWLWLRIVCGFTAAALGAWAAGWYWDDARREAARGQCGIGMSRCVVGLLWAIAGAIVLIVELLR